MINKLETKKLNQLLACPGGQAPAWLKDLSLTDTLGWISHERYYIFHKKCFIIGP